MRGDIDRVLFRDLAYGMSVFLGYWKAEFELDVEKRLEALEEQLR